MPRLPGIAHLILTDKTDSENNRMSTIDPVRISSFRIDSTHRNPVEFPGREKLTTERDDFDTDGSIPDLTEILPPPRRKRGRQQLDRTAIMAAATAVVDPTASTQQLVCQVYERSAFI